MRPVEQARKTGKKSESHGEHIVCSDKGAFFVEDTLNKMRSFTKGILFAILLS